MVRVMEDVVVTRFGIDVTVGLSVIDCVDPPPLSPAGNPLSPRMRLSDRLRVDLFSASETSAELETVADIRARLAAYEAVLVEHLATHRPALPTAPGDDAGWVADRTPGDVSEWVVEEVQLASGASRATAANVVDLAFVLRRQLPTTWGALADAAIDQPRARAIAAALGHQAESAGGPVPDAVVAAVEARALAWAGEGETPGRLKERVAGALVAADPAAADRRRRLRERHADVRTRATGDGMSELAVDLPGADAAACRAAIDAHARQWKADGDPRPIGQLRALTLRDLVLRPWDARSAVTAVLTLHADLDDPARQPAPGPSTRPDAPPPTVDGTAVTPAQVRCLAARLTRLPGALTDTTRTLVACTDPATGALRAVATARELRRASRDGRGLGPPPPVDRYEPTPAQRRFLTTRDRTCRFPGCRRPARGSDVDHVVAHGAGGTTTVSNLVCLCRRHHRLKTHAPGWAFTLDPDGTLHVTTPSGVTRTTRPPGLRPPPEHDPPPF